MLLPRLGTLSVPVVIYAVALTTMCIMAQRSDFGKAVAMGALLFLASDGMFALARFRASFPLAHALVWSTYFAAQLLITVGVNSTLRQSVASPATQATQAGVSLVQPR